jgi:hypothetical protein
MSYYDNVFTSNLYTGQNSGLNLKKNDLTSKLWTELSMDRDINGITNKKGAFFIVKTFNIDESKIIIDAIKLKLMNSFFFDKYGNLYITKDGDKKLDFTNILTNKKFDINNTGKSSIDLNSIQNPKIIMSENNKFMLNIENNIVKMLYNPIHRNSFKNYYGTQTTDKSGLNSQLNNLVNKYCEINAVPGTKDGSRQYADNTCKCLGLPNADSKVLTGECVDDALGSHLTNPIIRNNIGYTCICAAPSCKYDDPDSFFSPFLKNVEKNLNTGGKCPDIQNVICEVSIKAGSGVNLSSGQIQNNCGPQLAAMETTPPPTLPPATTTARPLPTPARPLPTPPPTLPPATTTARPLPTPARPLPTPARPLPTTARPTTTTPRPTLKPIPEFCSIL